jgi:biopolymer transport protein ExbD
MFSVRRRVGSGSEESVGDVFRPQMTSLIDILMILLAFLIKSFSVEGDLVTQAPDLELPVSTSQTPAKPACTIEITQKAILGEGSVIAALDRVVKQDSLEIPALFAWMGMQKEKITDTAQKREVLIQADRETAFEVLKKVMYTCSKAGFEDFSVLVVRDE